jgi:hypothetical protein
MVGGFSYFSCIVEPVAGCMPSHSGLYTAKVATNLATSARGRLQVKVRFCKKHEADASSIELLICPSRLH